MYLSTPHWKEVFWTYVYSTWCHRQNFHWPHMTSNVYTVVCTCCSWGQNGSQVTQMRKLTLFSAPEALRFVRIDILELLPRTTTENQLIFIITYPFSNVTQAILTSKVNSTQMPTKFLNNLIIQYWVLLYVLNNDRPQIGSKLLQPSASFSR